jgi:phosphoglycolate phosphatase-like HAD superfamily hydrolase
MKVLLFDIDGTLLRAYGAGMKSMRRAAEIVLGEKCAGADVDLGGAMDPWIFGELARHGGYNVDDALLERFRTLYRQMLEEELARPEARCVAMPGVHALLSHLRQARRSTLGLLTGNYAETGAFKLLKAGIDPQQFEITAWGDQAKERHGLVPVALAQLRRKVDPRDVIVIGDTVRDVSCAHKNGALCLAVTTGGGTREQLEAAGADLVLDTLEDLDAVLRFFGY